MTPCSANQPSSWACLLKPISAAQNLTCKRSHVNDIFSTTHQILKFNNKNRNKFMDLDSSGKKDSLPLNK